MRIVSLLPSSTEIVCALGFDAQLVGRSHECDYPKSVQRLPVCSEPKFDPHQGTSAQIDQTVKKIVSESLSVYRVHADKLKELKPDFIITQDQCEVCAVSLKDVEQAVCNWVDSRPKIINLRPDSLADVWKGIKDVAQALGVPQKGEELVEQYRRRMQDMADQAAGIRSNSSVACIEWYEPLMAAGNWIPELVTMLGGQSCFGQPGAHSPWISWEDLSAKDPDIIVSMPCGWDLERSRQEISTLTRHPGWNKLKAVKNGQVYLTDGHQYFNRPGPRLVESMEILAEIMYPDHFHFDHQGQGWQKSREDKQQ